MFEDQLHIFRCKVILRELNAKDIANENINNEDLFSKNVTNQKAITALFLSLFNRNNILNRQNRQRAQQTCKKLKSFRQHILGSNISAS
jgi:hypothetical protein